LRTLDGAEDVLYWSLVYVNRSRASALRGPFAMLRRAIVEHKIKGGLDRKLREIKARIEAR